MFRPAYRSRRARVTLLTGISAATVAVMALSACGSSGSSSAASSTGGSDATTNISIGINTAVAGQIEPALAQDSGIFKKLGINANVQVLPSSTLLADIAAGRVQFAAFGAPQPEEAVMAGANLKWYAVWAARSNLQLIVGPGIHSVADLKGKVIGITVPGSTTDIFARLALTSAGVSPNDVKFQPLQSGAALISAFASGSIAATVLSPPQSTTALNGQKGSSVLVNFATKYNWPNGGLVGYTPWVQAHQAAATAVVTGIAQAVHLYRSSPSQAESALKGISSATSSQDLTLSYKSALTTLQSSTIVPSVSNEQFVLSTLQKLYPGKYPKDNPSTAAQYIDSSLADAAMKTVGLLSS